ncbi:hypothetical protein CY34DRAFT_477002 [Suillus luteus UH-Slu-Lm8-n1]|uniref:Uncharacterized protein n=1 Tax=Suillus luteus UH-Slu-Lm8-n1 TaxID=930992 RepID=A0A0D0AZ06_9AGAM|nr:hypothetical protein CY34DRAFT_477002 [Suillus luteus UH-Slu-Lm8-n1]
MTRFIDSTYRLSCASFTTRLDSARTPISMQDTTITCRILIDYPPPICDSSHAQPGLLRISHLNIALHMALQTTRANVIGFRLKSHITSPRIETKTSSGHLHALRRVGTNLHLLQDTTSLSPHVSLAVGLWCPTYRSVVLSTVCFSNGRSGRLYSAPVLRHADSISWPINLLSHRSCTDT